MKITLTDNRYCRQGGRNHVTYVIVTEACKHGENGRFTSAVRHVMNKRFSEFVTLHSMLTRNDGFIRQIPFPPKSFVVDSEIRQKRQEALEAFLMEVSMSDLEARNKSLLQGFLGVSTTGVSATVRRYWKGEGGTWYYEICVVDRNEKVGSLKRRYSEFAVLQKKIGPFIKGLTIVSLPGKLLSNSEGAIRERRQELEDWLTQVNAIVPMTPEVETALFEFLDLDEDGLLGVRASTIKGEGKRKTKMKEGKGKRRDSALLIDDDEDDGNHFFDQMIDRVGEGGALHAAPVRSEPVPISPSSAATRKENAAVPPTPPSYSDVLSTSTSSSVGTGGADSLPSSYTPGSLMESEENMNVKRGRSGSSAVRRQIGKKLSKMGLSKKKLMGKKKGGEEGGGGRRNGVIKSVNDLLAEMESNKDNMKPTEITKMFEEMVEAPGNSPETGRVVIAVVLQFNSAHSVVLSGCNFLYRHTRRFPNVDFNEFIQMGGVAILCYSIKKNFHSKEHVGHMVELLLELGEWDMSRAEPSFRKALPGYAKQIFKHARALFDKGGEQEKRLTRLIEIATNKATTTNSSN